MVPGEVLTINAGRLVDGEASLDEDPLPLLNNADSSPGGVWDKGGAGDGGSTARWRADAPSRQTYVAVERGPSCDHFGRDGR
jgi:hypothetical protein